MIKLIRNVLLFVLLIEALWSFFFPEWKFSEERDVAIVQRIDANQKLVSRRYFNYKHNRWQTDTVKVQEFFVFRKVLYQIVYTTPTRLALNIF